MNHVAERARVQSASTPLQESKHGTARHAWNGPLALERRIGNRAFDALVRSGQPLDPVLRSDMEGRFGADFSAVRVHTDTRAAAHARDLDAHAFTIGEDIGFAAGRFAPASRQGKHLLAHELAHVVEQRATGVRVQLALAIAPQEGLTTLPPGAEGTAAPPSVEDQLVIALPAVLPHQYTTQLMVAAMIGFMREMRVQAKPAAMRFLARLGELIQSPGEQLAMQLGSTAGMVSGLVSPLTAFFELAVFGEHLNYLSARLLASGLTGGQALSREAAELAKEFHAFWAQFRARFNAYFKDKPLTLATLAEFARDLALHMAQAAGHDVAKSLIAIADKPWQPEKEKDERFLDVLTHTRENENMLEPLGFISSKIERAKAYFIDTPWGKVGYEVGYVVGAVISQVALLVLTTGVGNALTKLGGLLARISEGLANFLKGAGAVIGAIEEVMGVILGVALRPLKPLLAPLERLLLRLQRFLRNLLGISERMGVGAAEAAAGAVARTEAQAPSLRLVRGEGQATRPPTGKLKLVASEGELVEEVTPPTPQPPQAAPAMVANEDVEVLEELAATGTGGRSVPVQGAPPSTESPVAMASGKTGGGGRKLLPRLKESELSALSEAEARPGPRRATLGKGPISTESLEKAVQDSIDALRQQGVKGLGPSRYGTVLHAEVRRQLELVGASGWEVSAEQAIDELARIPASTSNLTVRDFLEDQPWLRDSLKTEVLNTRVGALQPDLVARGPGGNVIVWDLTSASEAEHLAKTVLYAQIFGREGVAVQFGESYWRLFTSK